MHYAPEFHLQIKCLPSCLSGEPSSVLSVYIMVSAVKEGFILWVPISGIVVGGAVVKI